MKSTTVAIAALTSTLLLAGCDPNGPSAQPTGPGASATANQPGAAGSQPAASQPGAAGNRPHGAAITWRGASITLAAGWRQAEPGEPFGELWSASPGAAATEELCLLRNRSADKECDGSKVDDWLYLYASERSGGAPGEPGHPDTLDASGMNDFVYDSGVVPCEVSGDPAQVQKGTRTIGGRLAYYGEWKVKCADSSPGFLAQRWVLPKSRIGVESYALTEQSAEQIRQMVTTMDLTGYRPTTPK